MKSEASHPQEQECRDLVDRILASHCFRRAARMRKFLLHVTDCALSSRPEDATEVSIGCQVFGRPADYNPGDDNIVRSEARNLRTKLDLYFRTEGKDEAIVLQIPKGAYVPFFIERAEAGLVPADATGSPELQKLPEPAADASRPILQRLSSQFLLSGLVVVLAILCAVLWWKDRALTQTLAMTPRPTAARNWIWDQMFDAGHETVVVVADSCVMELQDIAKKPLSLEDYIQPRPGMWDDPDAEKSRIMARIASRQLTSIADVVVSAGIVGEGEAYSNRAIVRFARKMDLRDFKGKAHVVLLGSSRSNPWVELFQASMNFRFEYDAATNRSSIRNLAPRGSEAQLYTAIGRETTPGETYGLIGLLPNLTGDGNVLIIAGATMEGTEAAGEFLLHPGYSKQLLNALQQNRVRQNGYFEALLGTRTGAGTSRDTELLACRPLPGRSALK